MKIAIKNRHTGKVIHSGDFGRINDCLEDGVSKRGSFRYADLEGVNLEGVNLRGVNLEGASDIIQFGPIGKRKRICYAVKHEDYVMLKLGCFWGTELEAVKAIKKKYGENSTYQILVYAACREVENVD